MKKLLALTLLLASIGFGASLTEAKAAERLNSPAATMAASAVAPQWRNQRRWDRRDNRRVRTVTQARLVRVGRQVYRETYQVMYWPNGRTQTRLIGRVRVR